MPQYVRSTVMQDTAKTLEETLARNLAKAERENATVYLQRILPASELPPVAGALLVKPIVPHLDASGEGLFTSVIPDNRCGPGHVTGRCSSTVRCTCNVDACFCSCTKSLETCCRTSALDEPPTTAKSASRLSL